MSDKWERHFIWFLPVWLADAGKYLWWDFAFRQRSEMSAPFVPPYTVTEWRAAPYPAVEAMERVLKLEETDDIDAWPCGMAAYIVARLRSLGFEIVPVNGASSSLSRPEAA